MNDSAIILRIARRVKAGSLDAGPKASFEEYNGRGAWAEATDSERKAERGSFALALRAIARQIA